MLGAGDTAVNKQTQIPALWSMHSHEEQEALPAVRRAGFQPESESVPCLAHPWLPCPCTGPFWVAVDLQGLSVCEPALCSLRLMNRPHELVERPTLWATLIWFSHWPLTALGS
jgi:hypothetical protein